VCFKEGHSATNCWHRFDADFVPDEKAANNDVHGYGLMALGTLTPGLRITLPVSLTSW
jgi:hypothetical protein